MNCTKSICRKIVVHFKSIKKFNTGYLVFLVVSGSDQFGDKYLSARENWKMLADDSSYVFPDSVEMKMTTIMLFFTSLKKTLQLVLRTIGAARFMENFSVDIATVFNSDTCTTIERICFRCCNTEENCHCGKVATEICFRCKKNSDGCICGETIKYVCFHCGQGKTNCKCIFTDIIKYICLRCHKSTCECKPLEKCFRCCKPAAGCICDTRPRCFRCDKLAADCKCCIDPPCVCFRCKKPESGCCCHEIPPTTTTTVKVCCRCEKPPACCVCEPPTPVIHRVCFRCEKEFALCRCKPIVHRVCTHCDEDAASCRCKPTVHRVCFRCKQPESTCTCATAVVPSCEHNGCHGHCRGHCHGHSVNQCEQAHSRCFRCERPEHACRCVAHRVQRVCFRCNETKNFCRCWMDADGDLCDDEGANTASSSIWRGPFFLLLIFVIIFICIVLCCILYPVSCTETKGTKDTETFTDTDRLPGNRSRDTRNGPNLKHSKKRSNVHSSFESE